jgi:hypothetical protein
MLSVKVWSDQFKWQGEKLVHEPTGASFQWSYPRTESYQVTINWGRAGDVLPNGDDYEREDIALVAGVLLGEQRERWKNRESHQKDR